MNQWIPSGQLPSSTWVSFQLAKHQKEQSRKWQIEQKESSVMWFHHFNNRLIKLTIHIKVGYSIPFTLSSRTAPQQNALKQGNTNKLYAVDHPFPTKRFQLTHQIMLQFLHLTHSLQPNHSHLPPLLLTRISMNIYISQ